MKSWICLCVAGLLSGAFAGSAQAATNVAALGVRSIDGDTDLERRLSVALHDTLGSFDDLTVSDREPSLEQMMLAHDCEEADAGCLGQVAKTLGVERLFYGNVVASERGYQLSLFVYDASKGTIDSALLRQLSSEQLGASAPAKAVTSRLVQRLLGRLSTGYVIVNSNAPHAEVEVNGIRRGALDESGMFTLELPIGEHMIKVVPRGEERGEERAVRIKPGESSRVDVAFAVATPQARDLEPIEQPPQKSRTSLRRVFGWVSVGLGAAFTAATIYSWVRLAQIADDDDYKNYRRAFPDASLPGGVSNVCREAKRGTLAARDPSLAPLEHDANSLCKEADFFEVAQYVFLGGAIAGVGVGTYLLISARPKRGELSLRPRFNGTSALLEASTSF